MTEIIRVRARLTPAARPVLPEGMIEVEGTAFVVGPNRPDIAEEQIRRRFFWKHERLGMGLPARR